MARKNIRRSVILVSILLLLLITGLYLIQTILSAALPANTIINLVTRTIARELFVQTRIQEVGLRVFPRPAIQALHVVFADPETGRSWVRADVMEIKLKILPLFKGKVLPEKISFKDPVIQIQRTPHGEWAFMGVPSFSPADTRPQEIAARQHLNIKEVIIQNASIEILDLRTSEQKPHRILQEADIRMLGFSRKAPIRLKVKGHFPHRRFQLNTFYLKGEVNLGEAPFHFDRLRAEADLLISQMPVDVSKRYFREFLNLHLYAGETDLQAHVSLRPDKELDMSGKLFLKNFLVMAPRYATKPFAGEEAQAAFSLNRSGDMVNVKHLVLDLEETSLWGHGIRVGNLNGKPWYGFSLHASGLSYENVRAYLPDKLLPSKFVSMLQHATSTGSIDIPLFEMTGGGHADPEINGEAEAERISIKVGFNHFSLNPNNEILPLKELNGEVFIRPDEIQFKGLRGSYGRTRVDRVTGTYARTPGSGTDVIIEGHMNLSEIRNAVHDLSIPLKSKTILSFLSHAAGHAEIRLGLSSRETETDTLALRGTIDLAGAGLRLPVFPYVVSGIQGRISFIDNRSEPFSLTAKINKLPTRIQGEVRQVLSEAPDFHLRMTAMPSEAILNRWFPSMQGRLKIKEGVPNVSVTAEGPFHDLKLHANLDLTETEFSFANWINKKKKIKFLVEMEGKAGKEQTLTLSNGKWESTGASLVFSGEIAGGETPRTRLKMKTDHLSLQSLARIIPFMSEARPESAVSGDLAVSFIPGSQGSLNMEGGIYLHQAAMRPWFSHRLLSNMTGPVLFQGKKIQARNITCRWGDLPVSFDVIIPRIEKPVPKLRIHVPGVDFKAISEEIFSTDKGHFKPDKEALKKSALEADLSLQQVTYNRVKLQDFKARMVLKNGVLTFPSFMTRGLNGAVQGKGAMDFISGDQPRFQAEAQISGVNAEKYLELFPHNRTFYAGEISGTIAVEGRFYPALAETARKMTGHASLLIQSPWERNYLVNFTNEIFHRIDIMMGKKDPLFRILEYDEMGGNFAIHDGKFHSTDFHIRKYHKYDVSGLTLDKLTAAVPIRMKYNVKAAGSFDFLKSYIDCYVMAQPFSIADRFISKIPIAGKVLTGKDESLYSVFYHFKGHTAYTYRGTEKQAKLDRTSFQDIPGASKEALKGAE